MQDRPQEHVLNELAQRMEAQVFEQATGEVCCGFPPSPPPLFPDEDMFASQSVFLGCFNPASLRGTCIGHYYFPSLNRKISRANLLTYTGDSVARFAPQDRYYHMLAEKIYKLKKAQEGQRAAPSALGGLNPATPGQVCVCVRACMRAMFRWLGAGVCARVLVCLHVLVGVYASLA